MLREYYDECSNDFNVFFDSMKHFITFIANGVNGEVLEELQNSVINFGNVLENKWGLGDTPIISCLENICENIYEISTLGSNCSVEKFKVSVEAMSGAFSDSLMLTDYHTSIVLIAKDEDKDIEEWLEYHIIAGIDHFYVYDNDSSPNFKKILQPYIDEGIITYHDFPGEVKQLEAYEHAVKHYKNDTKYMAFIDADEFLVSVDGRALPNIIDEIIDSYENGRYKLTGHAGGIGVNWRSYGTSGLLDVTEELLLKSHLMRTTDEDDYNVHIKTICNPRVVKSFANTPHACEYIKGYYTISENGSYIPGAFFFDSKCNKLRINHYFMKSEKEYFEKLKRGWPIWKHEELSKEQMEKMYRDRCDAGNKVYDDIMLRYSDKIKAAIDKRREKNKQ